MAKYYPQSLVLNEVEANLFAIIMESLHWKNKPTIARVAGGWVRDKLMGRDSVDIDIALDDQTGVEFANNLNEYLLSRGEAVRSVAVIQCNPAQSKHLETANIRVLGYDIDCVNLRAETYANTRFPTIRMGTPLEDALRRDFTINSLFYNINTRTVEDFTNMGLEDLEVGKIRTPMSPFLTFKDDPLRVLRAVRFAGRFYPFRIDEELLAAAKHPEISNALKEKITKERILKECEGMLTHSDSRPFVSLALLKDMHLLPSIIVPPAPEAVAAWPHSSLFSDERPADVLLRWEAFSMEAVRWTTVLLALARRGVSIGDRQEHSAGAGASSSMDVAGEVAEASIVSATEFGTEELSAPLLTAHSRIAYWASLVAGFSSLSITEKHRAVFLPEFVLRESLKMDGDTTKQVRKLFDAAQVFRSSLSRTAEATFASLDREQRMLLRLDLGLAMRLARELWRTAVLFSCALDLALVTLSHGSHSPAEPVMRPVILTSDLALIVQQYCDLQSAVIKLELDDVWELKPLFDGNQLAQVLGIPKGPLLGKLVDVQLRWQLQNPQGVADECLAFLRTQAEAEAVEARRSGKT